jgi:hypothetical protein
MFVQVFVMIRKPRLLAQSVPPNTGARMPHVVRTYSCGVWFGEAVRQRWWSNATVSDSLTFSFYRTDVHFATKNRSSCKDLRVRSSIRHGYQ